MNKFYVYAHYTTDGRTYYIGKGTGNRAWTNIEGRKADNKFWKNVYEKHGLNYKILHENLSEDEAYELEKRLITEERNNPNNILTNILGGGDGMTSEDAQRLAQDPEWRRKNKAGKQNMKKYDVKIHTERNKKLAQDPEWRRKNKEAKQKQWLSEEFRKKHKEATDKLKKEHTVVSPTGEIVSFCGINEFCRIHGLHTYGLRTVLQKKCNHHKGWKLYTPPIENQLKS